jgi:CRISPR-associated protein Cmr4
MTRYLLYLYAESPVHTGAANSLDVVDLPIQREASTGYPVIWGQSLKGALRQAARDAGWGDRALTEVFGSEVGQPGEDGGTTPGALAVGDAQLVAMPVPTLRHTFAWLTSDVALGRLARKYKTLDQDQALDADRVLPGLPTVGPERAIAASADWAQPEEVLGPFVVPFDADRDELAGWAGKIAADALDWDPVFAPFAAKLRADLILAGSELVPALLRECTEQAVRVQLERDTKTVKDGALFYSEYLPAETIMAASLTLSGTGKDKANGDTEANRQALADLLDKRLLQFGGDETIGKGLMWARLLAGPGGAGPDETGER